MDDFVLIHQDRAYLEHCLEIIIARLKEMGLETNPNKTSIQPITHGIKFLGFSYRLTETGKVVMKPLAGKMSKERKKLKKMAEIMTADKLAECYKSWRSFMSKGDTYRLLLEMDEYCERLKQ